MDATETESDVKLYKTSKELLKDLDDGIQSLRKPDSQGGSSVRPWVRFRETMKATCNILDSFQELPQLLDPHLPKWIPFLAETYLEYLQTRHRHRRVSNSASLLVPLDQAICRILYSFCKVRGEKVIVRFLNVETKYLELILSAVEDAEQKTSSLPPEVNGSAVEGAWSWEQRYITLLWLSHLLFAPFDLSTISSADIEEGSVPPVRGFVWPANVPGLTMRVIPLALRYIGSAGKERDAAKALLVRLAMRRDMQELGILASLVSWSLKSLQPQKDVDVQNPYFYLGVLSFLAGVLRSASETSDMDAYQSTIFDAVLAISTEDNEVSKTIIAQASSRKMIVKVIRSLVVSLLRRSPQDMASTVLTENAIAYLLERLSDNDTPVRLSASKSLSIITLKLDPDMASQVVEAVLESLNRNVLWNKPANKPGAKAIRDLSAVDPLEWHGLMLTLSHLLYRRSPPARQLSDIFHALLLGLSFEQRGVSGASVGANVRDAACFGIWGLARRYSTQELLAVPTTSVYAAKSHPPLSSVLQVLGTELVMTASLDPEGNIRRGASAALQELIGRHPDTVELGISVVQTVDYHAVARRSRAIQEVAINASRLSSKYGEAMVDGILGWRGIGDMDTASRRVAGSAFGTLTAVLSDTHSQAPFLRFENSIDLVVERLNSLQRRQVEERHGLLLCFAAVVDQFPNLLQNAKSTYIEPSLLRKILALVSNVLEDCMNTEYRRPELIAEGASQLVLSVLPVIQATLFQNPSRQALEKGSDVLSTEKAGEILNLVAAFDSCQQLTPEIETLILKLQSVVPGWLNRNEQDAVVPASTVGLMLLILSKAEERTKILKEWASVISAKPGSRSITTGSGYFHTMAMAQPLAHRPNESGNMDIVCEAFLERWSVDKDIETRITILQSLLRSRILKDRPNRFLNVLDDGLNDYTTTARGDEGSLVRFQTLRAIKTLWWDGGSSGQGTWMETSVRKLIYSVLRLSAEKLDRVRREAKDIIALLIKSQVEEFQSVSPSSKTYFAWLLNLTLPNRLYVNISAVVEADMNAWTAGLMAGFVTSADTGNEDLVIASRAALTDYCAESPDNLRLIYAALLHNLKTCQGEDRIIVPTLEIIAFLFHMGLVHRCQDVNYRGLCLQTQKAGYKSGNVRKLVACIKVYGAIAGSRAISRSESQEAGIKEARKRLGALMFHPWPRVRTVVVDELWGLVGSGGISATDEDSDAYAAAAAAGAADTDFDEGFGLTGVDWGAADKIQVKALIKQLRLE